MLDKCYNYEHFAPFLSGQITSQNFKFKTRSGIFSSADVISTIHMLDNKHQILAVNK